MLLTFFTELESTTKINQKLLKPSTAKNNFFEVVHNFNI